MMCVPCNVTSSSPCVDGLLTSVYIYIQSDLQWRQTAADNGESPNPFIMASVLIGCLCKLHVIILCSGGQWSMVTSCSGGVRHEIVFIVQITEWEKFCVPRC